MDAKKAALPVRDSATASRQIVVAINFGGVAQSIPDAGRERDQERRPELQQGATITGFPRAPNAELPPGIRLPRRSGSPAAGRDANHPNSIEGPMIPERIPAADDSLSARCARLNERQRIYLRHVLRHRKTKEIAHLENTSERVVDKQLKLAKDILGANDRFQAAIWFAEFEAGVGSSYPANSLPSQTFLQPLPMPVPTRSVPDNWLTWRPALIWGAIISLVVPLGLSVAALLILVLTFLFGGNLQ